MLEPPPDDLNDAAVAVAVADGWGIRVQDRCVPTRGAGGYHWKVSDATGRSLFVTADDLDTKDWFGDDRNAIAQGLTAAVDTARRLRHDENLDFVVAPLAAGDGRPAVRLGDRYAISVYPWLEGRSHPFAHQTDPARRDSTLDMLIALHTVDPPASTPHHTCPRVGARRDLEAFLHDPTDPWDEGPFGEQARAVFARHVDELVGTPRPVRSGRSARARPGRRDPRRDPRRQRDDGRRRRRPHRLGHRRLAAPERDLWLLGLDDPAAGRYTEATGHQPDVATLALYHERWLLDDIGHLIQFFRGRHDQRPGRPCLARRPARHAQTWTDSTLGQTLTRTEDGRLRVAEPWHKAAGVEALPWLVRCHGGMISGRRTSSVYAMVR